MQIKDLLNIVHLKSFMIYFIVALVAILYKPLLEYFFGATVGKYALDIKVSNANLEKITLTQSFKRSSISSFKYSLSISSLKLAISSNCPSRASDEVIALKD